jgi:hypothetical protein
MCKSEEPKNDLLPKSFNITGSAQEDIPVSETNPTAFRIECLCELLVQIDQKTETTDTIFYYGFAGGQFTRKILNLDESGFALQPDVFSEIIIKRYHQDSIVMIFPPNINDVTPFYRDVAIIKGIVNADNSITGSWYCSPFNLDYGEGLSDYTGTIKGDWAIEFD